MKFKFLTNKFWVALTTVSVIALVLCYYLFVVVDNQKAIVTGKGYRELKQIGKNLNGRISDLLKTADFIVKSLRLGKRDSIPKDSLQYFKRKIKRLGLDSMFFIHDTGEDSDIDSNGFKLRQKGKWYLETTYEKIVDNTFNKDFFDEFVIVGEDSISNAQIDKKKKKYSIEERILFQTFSNRLKLKSTDSLLRSSHGIRSGGLLDVVIDDEKYKAFVYRIQFNQQRDWTLIGFLKSSKFRERSYEVNHGLLFSIFLIIVVLLLALPVLKLAVMSGAERLHSWNVVSIGLSIAVGTTILVLIALTTMDYMKSELATFMNFKDSPKNKVHQLAILVRENFTSELSSILNQLKKLRKQTYYDTNDIKTKNYWVDGYYVYRGIKNAKIKKDSINKRLTIRHVYNQIIWIDANGEQVLRKDRNAQPKFFIPPNLSEREYFKKAKEMWSHKTDGFCIQSIMSWRNNESEAAVSIPLLDNKNEKSICLAWVTPFLSIDKPVLPPGYSICLINSKGEIQFHSTKTKNLKENLTEETEKNAALMASLSSRVDSTFEAQYLGKEHLFSIKPVNDTELFVVAYFDLENYRMPTYIATLIAMLLICTMVLITSVYVLLLFMATYKSSKLKTRVFFFQWLAPRTDENFLLCYHELALTNFCFCLLPFIIPSQAVYLSFLIIPVHIIFFTFIFLDAKGTGSYLKSGAAKIFTLLTIVFLLVPGLLTAAGDNGNAPLEYFSANVMIIVGYWLLYRVAKNIIRLFKFKYSLRYYYIFVISWLLATSVVPVMCFYQIGLINGSIMVGRNDLIETGKKNESRLNDVPTKYSKEVRSRIKMEDWEKDLLAMNSLGFYQEACNIRESNKEIESGNSTPPSKSEKFFEDYIGFSGILKEARFYKYFLPSDSSWFSSYSQKENSISTTYSAKIATDGRFEEYPISLSSTTHSVSLLTYLSTSSLASVFLRLIFFSVFFALLYLLLRFATKRVFGIEIFCERKSFAASVVSLKSQINSSPKIFLVGLPHSGKGKCLEELKKEAPVGEINWKSDINKMENEQAYIDKSRVLLTHFEYGLNNHELNQKKLAVLENLHKTPDTQIIISSSVQPVAVLDFYEAMIERALSKEKPDDAYKEIKEYRLAFRQWQNILSGFVTVYQSLLHERIENLSFYKNDQIEKVVKEELQYGTFLPKLEPLVAEYYNGIVRWEGSNEIHWPQTEDVILRIETLAESYYQAMWNSFTRKEKSLLFDLAKDCFVNTRNIKELKILMEKGVVKMEDSIRLMNRSFSNFILSVVREDEELMMEQEMAQKGTWNTVQMVLLLSLLGLAIFFTLAQQSLLQNFNALLTVVASVLALIAKFGGMFGGGTKAKDT